MCHRQHFMDETPFSLPKFSYSLINQDSGDCANIGIGDDSSRSQSSEPWMLTLNYKLQEVECRSRLSNN